MILLAGCVEQDARIAGRHLGGFRHGGHMARCVSPWRGMACDEK